MPQNPDAAANLKAKAKIYRHDAADKRTSPSDRADLSNKASQAEAGASAAMKVPSGISARPYRAHGANGNMVSGSAVAPHDKDGM